jgi:F0F1-type ATP synthase membrane subunit b/b'
MRIIDELEAELGERRGGLFSKKIDIGKCVQLTKAIRGAMPDAVREAEYVVENKQKILENADSVAKNTIREAEERAEHIIDNSELIKRAELEAKQLMETAYMQCDALVDKTKAHLDIMFRDVEQFLQSSLAMIRNNREELRGAMIVKTNKNQ